MSVARIITTTEKFGEMGKLVERIETEEFPEECGCRCGKQEENKSKSEEINQELIDSGFQVFKSTKLMCEILEEIGRMKSFGVPCPFFW